MSARGFLEDAHARALTPLTRLLGWRNKHWRPLAAPSRGPPVLKTPPHQTAESLE